MAFEMVDRDERLAGGERKALAGEERDHHPDLTLSWRRLSIMLTTHSADGVTEADLALAAELDRIAADFPLAAD